MFGVVMVATLKKDLHVICVSDRGMSIIQTFTFSTFYFCIKN